MNRFAFNHIGFFQFITVLALLLPVFGVTYIVWFKHQRLLAIMVDLEPRYARLQGLISRSTDLQAFGLNATAQLAQLAYPAVQDVTKSGNDAQQRIRALFAESRLDIISIQVLPAKETVRFDKISINLRVEGDLAGMQAALGRLSAQAPLVVLDNMTLQTLGAVRPASIQRLSGQFTFSVFRVRP